MLKSSYILIVLILMADCITAQDKIGAVDFNKLLERSPETTQAITTLKHMQDSLQMEYDNQAKKIDDEVNRFTYDTLCHMGMTPNSNIHTIDRKKLVGEITKLFSIEEMNQKLLKKMTDSTFILIKNKLKTSLKRIADENGYKYIFDLHSNAKFPLPPCEDITAIVMTKLSL